MRKSWCVTCQTIPFRTEPDCREKDMYNGEIEMLINMDFLGMINLLEYKNDGK